MKHMNPIMEAKELILKFREFANGTDDDDDRFSPAIEKENAKQCVLITVGVIEDFITCNMMPYARDKDSMKHVEYNLEHYRRVKQEVEAL